MEKIVEEVVRKHGLNPCQRNALSRVLKERLLLINGPPGTGKSQTALALMALSKALSEHLDEKKLGVFKIWDSLGLAATSF